MRKFGIVAFTSGFQHQFTILTTLVSAVAVLMSSAGSFANDSVIGYSARGIVFMKSEDIRMLEETLYISKAEVRVKYRFLNETDRDIRTTVVSISHAIV